MMARSGDQPIRVLRVIARMNVGGPAWQASVLTSGLDSSVFHSRLVCGRVADGEADFTALRQSDLLVNRISALGRGVRPLNDLRALAALRREIRSFQPHIVHTHTAKAGVLGRIAAISCRVPIRVHSYHGHLLTGYFGPLVVRIIRIVESLLARRTSALVAVGARVRDELIEAGVGIAEQYAIIPPGVRQGPIPSVREGRKALGIDEGTQVVLFVGRLTRIKRFDRLIKAMAIVTSEAPETLLVVAGEGDELEDAKRVAEPLGTAVRFLGWCSELSFAYGAADVVVLTSDSEGMPVSLIEAAMAGLPCVTTDVGSAGEVVVHGRTGYVVSTDPESISEALLTLLQDDGLRERMGDTARQLAERNFPEARLVSDHELLYKRLVADQRIGVHGL